MRDRGLIYNTTDINNLKTTGIYQYYREAGLPKNLSTNASRGEIIVFSHHPDASHIIQFDIGQAHFNFRMGLSGTWYSWISLTR